MSPPSAKRLINYFIVPCQFIPNEKPTLRLLNLLVIVVRVFYDGENIDFNTLVGISEKIVKTVDLPVSVDIEAGFSEDPATIVKHALMVVEIGYF